MKRLEDIVEASFNLTNQARRSVLGATLSASPYLFAPSLHKSMSSIVPKHSHFRRGAEKNSSLFISARMWWVKGWLPIFRKTGKGSTTVKAAPSVAVEDRWWSELCVSLRKNYAAVAAVDSSKPGQKARMVMAFVDTIEENGLTSPTTQTLVWGTYDNEIVSKQVLTLRKLMQTGSATADMKRVEYNLVARAGLLIDPRLVSPDMYLLGGERSEPVRKAQDATSHGGASKEHAERAV